MRWLKNRNDNCLADRDSSAAEVILSAALQKFPGNATIHFNLACYYTQLAELDKARLYLRRAIAIDENFKKGALTDPDLRALRE